MQKDMGNDMVLSLSDGEHSLLDIAERAGLSFSLVFEATKALVEGESLAT